MEPITGKYAPLQQYLNALPQMQQSVTLTFAELESLLSIELPSSAREHRPWWANQTANEARPQAKAWMSAGFVVDSVDVSEMRVCFARKPQPQPSSRPSATTNEGGVSDAEDLARAYQPPAAHRSGTSRFALIAAGVLAAFVLRWVIRSNRKHTCR
jgi:hypothetical protein